MCSDLWAHMLFQERDNDKASESTFWKEHLHTFESIHSYVVLGEREREREMAAMQVRVLFGKSTCVRFYGCI